MGNLAVDYGQASVVSRNISSALIYLEEEIAKINGAISEIESLKRGYGKTSTILNELYDQKKKAQTTYDEMKQFSEKFNGFIKNVKTTDSEMAKKFTADVKTYCKKNNIEITSEFDAFLDKVQVVLDVVGVIPVFGDVADALNAVISLCRGNYLEALICLVAILPMGDLLKGLKFADKAKDILKLGDKALTATKTVAKEGAEKLSKQMTKLVKSGKIDNVIATMDAGKDFVVKFKNGSTALIKKGDLSEFVCQAFNKGCFMAGTLVNTKEGLKPIEEVKIGEYVLSRNEESGETSYKKVTDTLIRSTYNICTIELENGKIKSTTGHLFMVQDKWWKAAAELKAGDILETADGKCKVVKSITVEEKGYPVTTYNLSVEDNHTFFVGKLGVLTHNMKGFTPCELADEVAEKATKGVTEAEIVEGKKVVNNRVNNMIENMTEGEKSRTTYGSALVKLEDGTTEMWVSSAGKKGYIPPRIRGNDKVIKNKSLEANSINRFNDAEQTIMREANEVGAEIISIGATRDMCPACQAVAKENGIIDRVATPLKKIKK